MLMISQTCLNNLRTSCIVPGIHSFDFLKVIKKLLTFSLFLIYFYIYNKKQQKINLVLNRTCVSNLNFYPNTQIIIIISTNIIKSYPFSYKSSSTEKPHNFQLTTASFSFYYIPKIYIFLNFSVFILLNIYLFVPFLKT